MQTMLDARDWLELALDDAGATILGGNYDAGTATLEMALEGVLFTVAISQHRHADGSPVTTAH